MKPLTRHLRLIAAAIAIAGAGAAHADFVLRTSRLFSGAAAPIAPHTPAPAALSAAETLIDFGTTIVGTPVSRQVTLSNVGGTAANLGFSALATPYGLSEDCPDLLEPSASCSLTLSFTPASPGAAAQHTLSVSGGAAPVILTLDGTGEASVPSTMRTVGNVLPYYYAGSYTPRYAVAIPGSRSFLVTTMNSGWGGSLYLVNWVGSQFTSTNIYTYNNLGDSIHGVGGVAHDARGFVVAGAGNYNHTGSFRIRTYAASGGGAASRVATYDYSTIPGANYGIAAIVADPSGGGGYYAVLRSSTVGAKKYLRFTVSGSGAIENVTAHGSFVSGEPVLGDTTLAAEWGADGKLYLAGTQVGAPALRAILALDPTSGMTQTVYAATYGTYGLTQGMAKDGAGNLYFGTTKNQILRAPWNGAAYGALEPVAGKLSTAGRVDGEFGTNTLALYSSIMTGEAGAISVIEQGEGGSSGWYRVLE